MTDEDLSETVKLVEALDQRCVAVIAIFRDTDGAAAALAAAVDRFDRLDVLLVNHGLLSLAQVVDMSDQVWDDVIASDLTGVFKAVRAALPQMIEQNYGRIVVTASMAGRTGLPTVAHYCAAKWGAIGFVKSVAREVADRNITVNAACPTNVNTDMIHNPEFYALFAPGIDNPTREPAIPGFQSLNAVPVRGRVVGAAPGGTGTAATIARAWCAGPARRGR